MPKASIRYLGHSSVLLTSELGKRIIIDPWLGGNPSCPKEFLDPGKLDLVCLTHGHSDHAASAVELLKKNGCPVAATYELLQLLIKDGVDASQICPMNKGGSISILGNLQVSLTQAFHSSSYETSEGQTHYAGEPCGVVLTLESGRSIYHAGDTLLFSDMTLIKELYRPEVSLLPIGDRFTMGPRQAAKAMELLESKYVLPIHWGTFPLLTGTPEELQKFSAHLDSQVVSWKPGEEFSF